MPVLMALQYKLEFGTPPADKLRWDLDALGECLQTGINRQPYLEAIQNRMERLAGGLRQAREDLSPDQHWDLWVQSV